MASGVGGFFALDGGAQAVESCRGLVIGRDGASGVRFAYGAGATVLGDEHLGCGASFLEFLLEAVEGGAEGFDFGCLVFELLGEALCQLLLADAALEGGAGEVVLLLLDG